MNTEISFNILAKYHPDLTIVYGTRTRNYKPFLLLHPVCKYKYLYSLMAIWHASGKHVPSAPKIPPSKPFCVTSYQSLPNAPSEEVKARQNFRLSAEVSRRRCSDDVGVLEIAHIFHSTSGDRGQIPSVPRPSASSRPQ